MATQDNPTPPSAPVEPTRPPQLDPRYLQAYLSDHLALSEGIGALAARARSAGRWSDHDQTLAPLVDALRRDRADLQEVLRRRGLKAHPVKGLLARAAERAGRLKGNGRLVRSSPLTRLIELEGLRLGVAGCMAPWETLQGLPVERDLAVAALERLRSQQAGLEQLHGRVAAVSFQD